MRKFLILLLFTQIHLAQAQVSTSYYLYDQDKIKIDSRSFTRYVLPQLRAISQEFFLILKKLHPIHENTIDIFKHVTEMQRQYSSFSKSCSTLNKECSETLNEIYQKARKLDRLILAPQRTQVNFSSENNKDHTDSLLHLISDLGVMANTNYRLMHTLEEFLLTANTNFFPYFDGKRIIEPKIHQMALTAELTLIQLLKPGIKGPFHTVWLHFFKKVDEKLLFEKDQEFLIKRLEELNLAWNTFHMKMTKENNDLSSQNIKLIKIMHNRWNSVLKIVLR